jgi:hypothetical protein
MEHTHDLHVVVTLINGDSLAGVLGWRFANADTVIADTAHGWSAAARARSSSRATACEPDPAKSARSRGVDRRIQRAVGHGVVVRRQRIFRVAGSRDPGGSPRKHRRRGMSNRL